MSYLKIKEISKITNISVATLNTLLCRPEFEQFMFNQNSKWNKHYDYSYNFLNELKKYFTKKNNIDLIIKLNKSIEAIKCDKK